MYRTAVDESGVVFSFERTRLEYEIRLFLLRLYAALTQSLDHAKAAKLLSSGPLKAGDEKRDSNGVTSLNSTDFDSALKPPNLPQFEVNPLPKTLNPNVSQNC